MTQGNSKEAAPGRPYIPTEQLRYAELLQWGGWAGLALLVATFVVYVAGLLPRLIAVDELPQMWRLPADELLRATGQSPGWAWVRLLDHGDVLNVLGIALLAGCSVVPLLAIVPTYLRRGDRIFAVLCVLEVAVLAMAASGLISAGR
jgi:hypothetical protein